MRQMGLFLAIVMMVFACAAASAADGLVRSKSPYSVDKTLARFVKIAKSKGLTIFKQVDHARGAHKVGMELRPTTVVIFGNPKAGTPFMQCAQTVGIDLPMKALVWRDAQGQVWFGYNDPAYIAQRHGVNNCPAVAPITKALSGLAEATVSTSAGS